MPAPAAGPIIYRFAPPTDTWTWTYSMPTENYSGPPPWNRGSEITDTYDLHSWIDGVPISATYLPDVCLGKEYTNSDVINTAGVVNRIKCNFSISELPSEGYYTDPRTFIIQTIYESASGYSTHQFSEGMLSLIVRHDGRLCFIYGANPQSTNTISVGQTYELELYAYDQVGVAAKNYQMWLDGELWLDSTTSPWGERSSTYTYLKLMAGKHNYGYMAGVDQTIHIENLVWTIEGNLTMGHWMMMAPDIA